MAANAIYSFIVVTAVSELQKKITYGDPITAHHFVHH